MCTIIGIILEVFTRSKKDNKKEIIKDEKALITMLGFTLIIEVIVLYLKCLFRGIRLFFKK